jgi:hypothetical protein
MLYFQPGATFCAYLVLDGALELTLGDGLTPPSVATVGCGCMFVVRSHNCVGLSPSASASLFLVHFVRQRPGDRFVG